ncbi:hypothetical protein [Helicobacter cinaedi]|uniref:Uncharacterized protein n=1 Tax=Helicobacter cinaedi TaxID=213 RepID=A0A377JVA3_9HELI|nr:Uncharacterised protein [Helicobacter cinaedi]
MASDRRDKSIVAHLCNDFTNAVVCDSANGYKEFDTKIQTMTKKIQAGDVMNVKALRRAIFMARAGIGVNGKETFPLKPIKADVVSEGGLSIVHNSYIILLESHQANQLKMTKSGKICKFTQGKEAIKTAYSADF